MGAERGHQADVLADSAMNWLAAGVPYIEDTNVGKQNSLRARGETEARDARPRLC